jgi:hypothetical protein
MAIAYFLSRSVNFQFLIELQPGALLSRLGFCARQFGQHFDTHGVAQHGRRLADPARARFCGVFLAEFGAVMHFRDAGPWFALQVVPRHEKSVDKILEYRGCIHFLPTVAFTP